MENRSHALIAGLFTIVLVLAAVVTVLWLRGDDARLVPYDLVTTGSVRGLAPQAEVRYRGLNVGKVESIGFDPAGRGPLLVRIGVREGTPMTDTLKATIEMKGVTGVAYVDLNDDGAPGRPLPSSQHAVARIEIQPGLVEQLMGQAGDLMDRLKQAGDQVAAMLGPENQASLQTTMRNAAQASARLDELLAGLEPALAELGPTLRSFRGVAEEATTAAREFSGLASDARGTLRQVAGRGGAIDQATEGLRDLRRAAGQLTRVAPEVSGAVDGVSQAARSADRTLRSLERSPQSILFGPATPRPGPGEPGFVGFRGQ